MNVLLWGPLRGPDPGRRSPVTRTKLNQIRSIRLNFYFIFSLKTVDFYLIILIFIFNVEFIYPKSKWAYLL